jgi:putative transposase
MLPDHVHAIWTLPADDCDYSKRWGIVKKHFTQTWLASGCTEQSVTASGLRYRRPRHLATSLLGTRTAR